MKPAEGSFLSIGAGKNQLPLIKAAKARGLYVIAVDQNSMAPGFSLSDIRIHESTKEYRKIFHAVTRVPFTHKLKGIATRSFGDAVQSTAYLADKFKLIGNSLESVSLFSNKKKIKTLLARNGILVPKSIPFRIETNKKKKIEAPAFPILVKPAQGFGKKGIKIIPNEKEWLIWSKSIRPEQWIMETIIDGDEVTVLGMVIAKKFYLISLSDKITTKEPPFIEIAHIAPSKRIEMSGEIKMICQSIVRLTGLKNGPFVAEFKINEFGECFLLEAAPEVGGEYLAEQLLNEAYAYPYFQDLLSLYIGEKPKPKFLFSNSKKSKLSAILFRLPNKKIKNIPEEIAFPLLEGETLFFKNQLLATSSALDGLEGNARRSYVYGISTSSKTAAIDWSESLLNRIRN